MTTPAKHRRLLACVASFAGLILASSLTLGEESISFERRVRAQEAIERIYYRHQLGATRPFDEVMPRDALEAKVETYLKQSVALERFWNTPITAHALARDLERMRRDTRMPQRLSELFSALEHDSVLIQETLVRQFLVARLTAGFFAFDSRIHSEERRSAEILQERLRRGEIDPRAEHPSRVVVDAEVGSAISTKSRRVGNLREERTGFVVEIELEPMPESNERRLAVYFIPKVPWSTWWAETSQTLDARAVRDVARATRNLGVDDCETDDTWLPTTLADFPEEAMFHSTVWTGTEMIVWGGSSPNNRGLETGSRYDPATDHWRAVSTLGAPSPRLAHTAVWTGTEMIVWGGFRQDLPSTLRNDGARYDPATDRWTEITPVGAPVARRFHTAVWTGSVMIVWGGSTTQSANSSTGGRYDPATDSWTPTAIDPAGRMRGHTAVWTGDRMLLFGGTFTNGFRATDGRSYDPSTDSWSRLSTIRQPEGRTSHAAVWTGTEMIVWGGFSNGENYLDTGARYNPQTNQWTTMQRSQDVVAARSEHVAVWTGTEMVAFGGRDGAVLDSGGAYDPLADEWRPIVTEGGPGARRSPTAIWTGSLMVIWGDALTKSRPINTVDQGLSRESVTQRRDDRNAASRRGRRTTSTPSSFSRSRNAAEYYRVPRLASPPAPRCRASRCRRPGRRDRLGSVRSLTSHRYARPTSRGA